MIQILTYLAVWLVGAVLLVLVVGGIADAFGVGTRDDNDHRT